MKLCQGQWYHTPTSLHSFELFPDDSGYNLLILFKGCQYREHTVQILNDRDRAILKLAQVAAEGNCLYEQPPSKLLKASVLNETWWNGIILTPSKDRPGLLPPIVLVGNFNYKFQMKKVIFFIFFIIFNLFSIR